jgi:hypothetical protein
MRVDRRINEQKQSEKGEERRRKCGGRRARERGKREEPRIIPCCNSWALKGQSHEIFKLRFFHQTSPPW